MNHFIPATPRPAARRRGPHVQAGVTMVEFIIVTPFALLLVLGIIQLGLMYSAKSIVNEAAFVAARAGSVQNAQKDAMTSALTQALIPFYQNTLDTVPATRIANAWVLAQGEAQIPGIVKIDILSPSPDSFSDFGLTDPVTNKTYIPNDNLEYRDYQLKAGGSSGQSIQDANVLRIKVTYGYQLKVPMMQSVIKAALCGFDSGMNATGRGGTPVASAASDCALYYSQGRVPIVAYATIQMQSRATQ